MTIAQITFLAVLLYGGSFVLLTTVIGLRRGDWEPRRDGLLALAFVGVSVAVALVFFLPPLAIGAVASIVMLVSGLGLLLTRPAPVAPGTVGIAQLTGRLLVASGALALLGTIVALLTGGR